MIATTWILDCYNFYLIVGRVRSQRTCLILLELLWCKTHLSKIDLYSMQQISVKLNDTNKCYVYVISLFISLIVYSLIATFYPQNVSKRNWWDEKHCTKNIFNKEFYSFEIFYNIELLVWDKTIADFCIINNSLISYKNVLPHPSFS